MVTTTRTAASNPNSVPNASLEHINEASVAILFSRMLEAITSLVVLAVVL